MESDEFDLARFVSAQESTYAVALAEIRAGRKRSHWIWFVFPQLKGLGSSAMSGKYGLSSLEEARAYFAHPVLGRRLLEGVRAMQAHQAAVASSVLGELDAMKFRSCLTLFSVACPSEPTFSSALERLFAGKPDARTLELLRAQREV